MDDLEQPVELPDSAEAPADTHEEPQSELDAADDDLDPDAPPAEEDEEIEIDGEKFALPKSKAAKLNAERLMHADYTRKTQEVAATRQQVEQERAQIQTQAREQQHYIAELAKVTSIDERIAQYDAAINLEANDVDPKLCQQYIIERDQLYRDRAQAVQALTQKQQQFALNEQQALAKQLQDASERTKREIPTWTDERDNEVTAFAVAQGIPLPQLVRLIAQNPVLPTLLHKAELYDRLEKQQQQKTAKPKTPAPPPAPVTRVSASRATASKDPDKMSTEAWAKQFYAERAKRR